MKINKQKQEMLSRELLGLLVDCDPETGEMWRILKRDAWGNSTPIHKPITGKNNRGYYWTSFRLDGRKYTYLVHRLIFLWVTGENPDGEIDHINGDRSDNRWVNLRECTPLDNSRNQGVRRDNTSGVRGVNYNTCAAVRGDKRWVARISHEGERFHLGNFATFGEAVAARKQAEIDYGYHENHAKRKSWQE